MNDALTKQNTELRPHQMIVHENYKNNFGFLYLIFYWIFFE